MISRFTFKQVYGNPFASEKLASPKQVSFILSLVDQAYDEPERSTYRGSVKQAAPTLSMKRASQMIENLQKQVKVVGQRRAEAAKPFVDPAKVPGVSALARGLRSLTGGTYAVRDGDKVRFLRIDLPRSAPKKLSKWDGYVFIKEQAGDELHRVGTLRPIETDYSGRYAELLAQIVADEKAAFALYGHELGHCGVCGRTLTDELSRERGIGPVCWEKL